MPPSVELSPPGTELLEFPVRRGPRRDLKVPERPKATCPASVYQACATSVAVIVYSDSSSDSCFFRTHGSPTLERSAYQPSGRSANSARPGLESTGW